MAFSLKTRPVPFVKAKHDHKIHPHTRQEAVECAEIVERKAGKETMEFYEDIISQSFPKAEGKPDSGVDSKQESRQGKKRWKSSDSKVTACNNKVQIGKRSGHDTGGGSDVRRVNELLKYCQEGNVAEVRKVLENGEARLSDTDHYGWTPLMCAAYSGHVHLVKYLLSKAPTVSTHRNKQGQTALELAQMAGRDSVVQILHRFEQRGLTVMELRRGGGSSRRNSSATAQPWWCEVCQQRFTDAASMHKKSTVHLFSCGHEPNPTFYHIPESNRGFQMMLKEGWDKEKGLGREGEGSKFPVKTILKRDRQGLGADETHDSKPRITHFKPFDADAVKRVRKPGERKKAGESLDVQKRSRQSNRHRHKAMEIDFRMSFHTQP